MAIDKVKLDKETIRRSLGLKAGETAQLGTKQTGEQALSGFVDKPDVVYPSSQLSDVPKIEPTIDSATLGTQAPPIVVPEIEQDTTTDFNGIINDVIIPPTPEIPEISAPPEQPIDPFAELKDSLADTPPVDPSIAFEEESKKAGIEEKQRIADIAASEVAQEQANLQAINAQLVGISSSGQRAQLRLEQEAGGKNITTEFLGRQQQEISRQSAIKALPIQALALASQAKIASLRGNEAAAQTMLTRATDKLNTAFMLRSQYEDRLYDYNNKIRDRIYEIADKAQQRAIDAQEKKETREYNEKKDMINLAQQYSVIALRNNQSEIASALTNPDLTNQEIQELIGQIKIAPEVEKLGTQVVEVAGRKLLINTQTGATIRDLGVADGIPDISGVTTLTGKPMTDAQALTFGYGTRMSDANVTILELESEFTGTIGIITGHKWFPGIFKTEDRLRIEQAQRNFINATLRKESGAAIAPSEFESAAKQYFPQPGDTDKVLEQKARNRTTVISNFAIAANVPLSEITKQETEETPPGGGSYEDYLKSIK